MSNFTIKIKNIYQNKECHAIIFEINAFNYLQNGEH